MFAAGRGDCAGATVTTRRACAITVMGRFGIAFTWPDTVDVSPVNTHRPSSCAGVRENLASVGSRTPANAHCVFHQENFR